MHCNMDKEENKKSSTHSPLKHMFHMVICCGLPLLIILSLPFIGRYNQGIATLLGIIAPFICPIMMGGMMFMLFGKKKKENTMKE